MQQEIDELFHVSFSGCEAPRAPRRSLKRAPSSDDGRRDVPEGPGPDDSFAAWLLGKLGIDARSYRASALARRIPACLRILRERTCDSAMLKLTRKPELLVPALGALLIGASEYFRDRGVFDDLRANVLPRLLREKARLSILSVGCSSGQELYSMAMLLHQADALGRCCLTGLDCRADAIEKARAGIFTEHEMKGLEPDLRARYFRLQDGRWASLPSLSRAISWQVANILACSFPASDIILFRNVAIYLETQAADCLWNSLCASLPAGGVLITGKAEKPPKQMPLKRLTVSVYQKIE